MRIGRTGGGQYPCFRILYNDSGVENVFGAFIDTGKPYRKNLHPSPGAPPQLGMTIFRNS